MPDTTCVITWRETYTFDHVQRTTKTLIITDGGHRFNRISHVEIGTSNSHRGRRRIVTQDDSNFADAVRIAHKQRATLTASSAVFAWEKDRSSSERVTDVLDAFEKLSGVLAATETKESRS